MTDSTPTLTDEQRAQLKAALDREWPMPTLMDGVAAVVARMVADAVKERDELVEYWSIQASNALYDAKIAAQRGRAVEHDDKAAEVDQCGCFSCERYRLANQTFQQGYEYGRAEVVAAVEAVAEKWERTPQQNGSLTALAMRHINDLHAVLDGLGPSDG